MMNGNHHPQQSQQSHTQIETQEIVHTNVPFDHHHHHTLNAANSYGKIKHKFDSLVIEIMNNIYFKYFFQNKKKQCQQ